MKKAVNLPYKNLCCSWSIAFYSSFHLFNIKNKWLILSFVIAFHCQLPSFHCSTWWRHQMETFSALLAICAGYSPVTGEFPAQRPVTWSFDVFFDLLLSKQSWGWWFETPSCPLWRHSNECTGCIWQRSMTSRDDGAPCSLISGGFSLVSVIFAPHGCVCANLVSVPII